MISLILLATMATSEAISPAWSPDGKRIAFSREVDEERDIWVFELGSKALTRITRDGSCYDPAWSPGGGKLIYTFLGIESYTSELRIMGSDGRGDPTVYLKTGDHGIAKPGALGTASWSPKGDRLVMHGSTSQTTGIQILLMDLATMHVTALTNKGSYNDWPRWSPDGKQIVFAGGEDSQQVYVVHADGSGLERITKGDRFTSAMPCWSPDGKKIAYISNRGDNVEIYAFDLSTRKETRLTDVSSHEFEPVWSPDGKRICVSSEKDGVRRLFTFDVSESPARKLDPLF